MRGWLRILAVVALYVGTPVVGFSFYYGWMPVMRVVGSVLGMFAGLVAVVAAIGFLISGAFVGWIEKGFEKDKEDRVIKARMQEQIAGAVSVAPTTGGELSRTDGHGHYSIPMVGYERRDGTE